MKTELLDYMRRHRLVVRSSIGSQGEPQAALVGIVVSPACESSSTPSTVRVLILAPVDDPSQTLAWVSSVRDNLVIRP
jgi:hypothetical protein